MSTGIKATVVTEYNRDVTRPPRVKIGNWVEERYLFEQTLTDAAPLAKPACETLYIHAQDTHNLGMDFETTNSTYGKETKVNCDPNTIDLIGHPALRTLSPKTAEEQAMREFQHNFKTNDQSATHDIFGSTFKSTEPKVSVTSENFFHSTRGPTLGEICTTRFKDLNESTGVLNKSSVSLYTVGGNLYNRTGDCNKLNEKKDFSRNDDFSKPIEEK